MLSLQSSTEILRTDATYISYLEEQVLIKNLKIIEVQKENQKLLEEIEFLKKRVADYGELRANHAVAVIQNSDTQACLNESQNRVDELQKQRSDKTLADAKAARKRAKFWESVRFFLTPQGIIEYQSTQWLRDYSRKSADGKIPPFFAMK
jgi:hypothetical protein